MTRHYLLFSEFVPYAPTDVGVVRINHVSPHCSGESRSMKIERTPDGIISAKCFRCGAWGIDSSGAGSADSIRASLATPVAAVPSDEDQARRLGRTEPDTAQWPLLAYHWLTQYGIKADEIADYGIMYACDRRRVMLPVWWQGKRVGYQLRKIYENDDGPKYDSRVRGGVGFMSFGCVPSNTVVIVEDILSAIKVGRQVQAVALLSTGLTRTVKEVLSHYDNFYIWLDMDNPQVIRQAVNLLKTLAMFGSTKLIQTEKDPKGYTDSEIAGILYAT